MDIVHGRVRLTLHRLAQDDGAPVLLLHELYGDSQGWGGVPQLWRGGVYGLDFCGHGASQWVSGGCYNPELLAGDADAALHHLTGATLVGVGIGAYVALLLAGARSASVAAAVLVPGAGLGGHGAVPDYTRPLPTFDDLDETRGCDPMVRMLEYDIRPVDYAQQFAVAAQRLLLVEDGSPRPPWWEATRTSAKAEVSDSLETALSRLR